MRLLFRHCRMGVVGRAGVAPTRVTPTAFEAAVSAVPPPTRLGPPAGSAPALRGYKLRALLVTPGRHWSSWPDSHRHPPRGGPGSQPGASTVSPQLVVPPAGAAPATSGVSGRRSAWLSYVGIGLPGRARTCGLPLRRRALCRLSYWELVGRAGFEPASGSLKESYPWPLDERPRES